MNEPSAFIVTVPFAAWVKSSTSRLVPLSLLSTPGAATFRVVSSSTLYASAVAVGIANVPCHCCCMISLTAIFVSILPVWNSSSQSPPSCALPVRSLDAATSAPVNCASAFTRDWPSLLAARSQPYNNRSPSAVKA